MDHNKKPSTKNKHGATASTSSKLGKHDEKKDENAFSKVAHQFEEKVHNLTDDVKEKAHHLTHMDDEKKDKNAKKTKNTTKSSSKPSSTGKKESSDDDDEDISKPPAPPPPKPANVDKKESSDGKDENVSKPPVPPPPKPSNVAKKVSSDGKDENVSKARAPPPSPAEPQSGHQVSGANPASSAKPANNEAQNTKSVGPPMSSESKQTTNQPNNVSSNSVKSNPSPTEENSNDKVHISFNGVETVDDLLERVDEAVEKAKVVVDTRKDKSASNGKKEETSNTNDIEKKTQVETEKEPIHITYNDIHQLKDLLVLVDDQPGHRKVVLEGVPKQSNVITFKKTDNSSSAKSSGATKNKAEDASTKKKPLENATCSVDKSPSEFDLIHVNIENIESVDDLLDRIDDAVENIRVVIDTESPRAKTPDSSKSNDKSQSERRAGTVYKKDVADAMKFQKQNLEIEPADNKQAKTTF